MKGGESGIQVAELCDKYGISEGSYYAWKNRYESGKKIGARTINFLKNEKVKLKNEKINQAYEDRQLGMKIEDICRKCKISESTYRSWITKAQPNKATEDQTLKNRKIDFAKIKLLTAENAKLKKLNEEQTLDIKALMDVLSKKW